MNVYLCSCTLWKAPELCHIYVCIQTPTSLLILGFLEFMGFALTFSPKFLYTIQCSQNPAVKCLFLDSLRAEEIVKNCYETLLMERRNTLRWDFWQTQIKFSDYKSTIQPGRWKLLKLSVLGQMMQVTATQSDQIGSETHKADVDNMIHITFVNTMIKLHYFWNI